MANRVCVLSEGEAEALEVRGEQPCCALHRHVGVNEAFYMTAPSWMYRRGHADGAVARWAGPKHIVIVRAFVWQPVVGAGYTVMELVSVRVPLRWAMTQNKLGTALQTLGQRESGTGRLEEAAEAYREALKERTREQVALEWATTQSNLGDSLGILGSGRAGPGDWKRHAKHSDWLGVSIVSRGEINTTLGSRLG